MSKHNQFEDKVKKTFAYHPTEDQFHFTADGQAFRNDSDAKNHAKNLADKTVQLITRAQSKRGEFLDSDTLEGNHAKAQAAAAATAKANSEGNEFLDATESPLRPSDTSPEGEEGSEQADKAKDADKQEANDGKADKSKVPTKEMTVPEIKAWLDERGIKYAHNAKEDNLLAKADEYLAANPEG